MSEKEYEGKTVEVEFMMDGVPAGKGFIFIRDGAYDTEDAETEFYKSLRGMEKTLRSEWEAEYKEFILENLTKEQEEILKDIHAKSYVGTDDDMPDEYENFLYELDLDELLDYLKLEVRV